MPSSPGYLKVGHVRSTHPPHVHSDSVVTGTYYARRPHEAAPLVFEDPRGRSPFDLVAGLEHRLRYGADGASHAGAEALPPFDRTVALEPRPGECVLFPPWLVHSVPPRGPEHAPLDEAVELTTVGAGERRLGENPHGDLARDEMLRVSFSFNLLGRWEHTSRTRMA